MALAVGLFAGTSYAGTVAGAAGNDFVDQTSLCLVGQVGVCQQGTTHGNAVNQTAFYDVSCEANVVDLTYCVYGDVNNLLDFGCFVYVDTDFLTVRGQDVVDSFVLGTAGNFQQVNASFFQLGSQVYDVLQSVAAFHTVRAGDTQEDGEVFGQVCTAFANNFQNEASAVVDGAAVFVHTLVTQGGPEGTGQHVSVCTVQAHSATAGSFNAASSCAVLLDDGLNFVYGDGTRNVTVCVLVGGGAQRSDATVAANGFGAGVDDLGNQGRTGVGYALCESSKLGNQFVTVQSGSTADVPVLVVNGNCVDNNEAYAAFCTTYEYVSQALGNGAVSCFVVHAHGSQTDAVLQNGATNLEGAKQLGIFHFHVTKPLS